MGEIKKRVQSPALLNVLLYRKDSYGESILEKTLKRIRFSGEIAASFGFDADIASAIVVMTDLATPCYGEIGDRFLQEIDPGYTREEYAVRLTRKVLAGLDETAVDTICRGIRNTARRKHTTPEEQIAILMQKCFAFTDQLENRSLASLFVSRYTQAVISQTVKTRVLSEHPIRENTLPKRKRPSLSPEEARARMLRLKSAHSHFAANPQELPGDFQTGWGHISGELLAAYYVVGTDDLFLEKFAAE